MRNKLTAKQAKFVKEYMIDLNATQACIRAGYSARTANNSASRLLLNAGIKSAISKLTEKHTKKAELTVDKVLANIEELRRAGYETGQLAASSSAIKMQAQYLAMLTDKVDQNIAGELTHTHKQELNYVGVEKKRLAIVNK